MEETTISLTRYNEPNWLIFQTLDTIAKQRGISAEVLFLDQQDDAEAESYTHSLTSESIRFSYVRIPARSLSYARNQAIERAQNDVILFLDSDALADEQWASILASTLAQDGVGVVGGRIVLKWHAKPLFVARAKIIRELYSTLDLGAGEHEILKVVGASFGLHRQRLGKQAHFDEQLGRRGGKLLGGEESDLCRRCLAAGLQVRYAGGSRVDHQVLPERSSYRWLLQRLYYAGYGRALVGGMPNPYGGKLEVWDLVILPFYLPPYALGFLSAKFRKVE